MSIYILNGQKRLKKKINLLPGALEVQNSTQILEQPLSLEPGAGPPWTLRTSVSTKQMDKKPKFPSGLGTYLSEAPGRELGDKPAV